MVGVAGRTDLLSGTLWLARVVDGGNESPTFYVRRPQRLGLAGGLKSDLYPRHVRPPVHRARVELKRYHCRRPRWPRHSSTPTTLELARHGVKLSLLTAVSGSEGGEAQQMRAPAVRHPFLDARAI
jgi:hypothetical protein